MRFTSSNYNRAIRHALRVTIALALFMTIVQVAVERPATADGAGLTWAPPVLSNPIYMNVTTANQSLRLDGARDYRLTITEPLTRPGGLVISGGRNVVLIGGEVRVPTADVAPVPNDRRGLYLKGQTGTIHIEGLRISGNDLTEGVDLDERSGATVQFQNIQIDTVHGSLAGNHADLIQTWSGPKQLRIDRFKGSTDYQGFFLLPHQYPGGDIGQWEFKNVDITGTPVSGYMLWKEDGHSIAASNVNVRKSNGATDKMMWPNAPAWPGVANAAPSADVLTGVPGMGYTSPGYAGAAPPMPAVTSTTTTAAPITTTTTSPTTTAVPTTTVAPTTSTTTTPSTVPATTPATTAPTTTTMPPVTTTTAVPVATPAPSLPTTSVPTPRLTGYWMASADGGVFSFGNAGFYGSVGGSRLNSPIVTLASLPNGKGYWLAASDGGIFAFGAAAFHGSTGGMRLNSPIVGMASTPSGNGYWLVARDGGIFSFGDAKFFGSTGALRLNKPIVGMASTSSGNGYWLVASDGGIFAFGDAAFFGSTGAMTLNQPIVGMANLPNGAGYWLVGADGGVFSFGQAAFKGSAAGVARGWATGISSTATGNGYWISTTRGSMGAFGDAADHGSLPATSTAMIVGASVVR